MINIFKVVAETYRRTKALTYVDSTAGGSGGWFGIIREAWAGAWQASLVLDAPKNILAFSAVYSCVSLISSDVAKCEICLKAEGDDGIDTEITTGPFVAVLQKPNDYQTRFQFVEQWITQKLLHGNAYVLKEREPQRGMVSALHVLDSQRVKTLIAEDGSVFYQLMRDDLAGVGSDEPAFPASEIIHDRMTCLFHPLVGVSPIYACGQSATMGNKIQANSIAIIKNMASPSGHFTSPNKIDDETAARMKKDFEEKFGNGNLGRVLVTGVGLEYKPTPKGLSAMDAQLIEQLKFTVEDVARAFHMPMFKLGGDVPRGSTVELLGIVYFTDCIQAQVESIEACLDEGLELPSDKHTELDLDALLRMDNTALVTAEAEAVKGGIKAPNESRKRLNLPPTAGGETPYMQQQNFSLAALAKRDAKADPFETTASSGAAGGSGPANEPAEQDASALSDELVIYGLHDATEELQASAQ